MGGVLRNYYPHTPPRGFGVQVHCSRCTFHLVCKLSVIGCLQLWWEHCIIIIAHLFMVCISLHF